MATEIERKYLVVDDSWRSAVSESIVMAQGYLNDLQAVESGAMKTSIRARIEGDVAKLNIKSGERGVERQEFEYGIPVGDAHALLSLAVGGLIEKTRHIIPAGNGLKWEVDEFAGDNAGLIVAEIELPSADHAVEMPSWAGREVTDDIRFYNLSLADYPYKDWSAADKEL